MLIDGGTCRYSPMCAIHDESRRVPVDIRRGARGANDNYQRVLNIDDVKAILRRWANGESRYTLAAEFGVCYTTIYDVTKRRTWKWVTP